MLAFHSRYKLQLLAHHQAGYREIGPFVARLHEWDDLDAFFVRYREKLMAILRHPASRKNHTNVLMHIGAISPRVEQQATRGITRGDSRLPGGPTTYLAPLTLLKHYLAEHPDDYLRSQNYFEPYPDTLGLRLAIT